MRNRFIAYILSDGGALILIVYLLLEIEKFHDKKLTRVRYRRVIFEKECTRT
jgi:hypothetical protein